GKIAEARQIVEETRPLIAAIQADPLDKELFALVRTDVPTLTAIAPQIAGVAAYLESANTWYGFLFVGRKKTAAPVLARFGLTLSVENAQRVHKSLTGLKTRWLAKAAIESLGLKFPAAFVGDAELVGIHQRLSQLFEFFTGLFAEPAVADVVG